MDELKPCPFCGGEAAQRDFTEPFVNGWVGCQKCHCFINWVKGGKPEAIAVWNRRAAPENKALTLKEMQSIQEPTRLWIVDLWGEMIPHYELVGWEVLRACPLTKKLHCVSLDGGDDFIDLDSYGRTWLAYARKPEKPHE